LCFACLPVGRDIWVCLEFRVSSLGFNIFVLDWSETDASPDIRISDFFNSKASLAPQRAEV
jgi:hypothetical protein